VGGNIGNALISMIDSSRDDGWSVVEVSSFQLETIVDFHPTVAAVLNVTPNHMDRYESLNDYAAAKHNIFRNQTAGDVAILNADDEIVSSWASGLRAHVVQFSVQRELEEGLFLRGRELVSRTKDGERVLMNRDEMQLRGTHNVENVLAAFAAGLACGASLGGSRGDQRRAFRQRFKSDERRCNDESARSIHRRARQSRFDLGRPGKESVVLAAGGSDKGTRTQNDLDWRRRADD